MIAAYGRFNFDPLNFLPDMGPLHFVSRVKAGVKKRSEELEGTDCSGRNELCGWCGGRPECLTARGFCFTFFGIYAEYVEF